MGEASPKLGSGSASVKGTQTITCSAAQTANLIPPVKTLNPMPLAFDSSHYPPCPIAPTQPPCIVLPCPLYHLPYPYHGPCSCAVPSPSPLSDVLRFYLHLPRSATCVIRACVASSPSSSCFSAEHCLRFRELGYPSIPVQITFLAAAIGFSHYHSLGLLLFPLQVDIRCCVMPMMCSWALEGI